MQPLEYVFPCLFNQSDHPGANRIQIPELALVKTSLLFPKLSLEGSRAKHTLSFNTNIYVSLKTYNKIPWENLCHM